MNAGNLNDAIEIRPCEESDLTDIQSIYAEQVLHGSASFEEVPPTVDEMLRRRSATIAEGFPYIVAVCDNQVVGYAYAGRYRTRSAYRHTGETSVYVHKNNRGRGVGRKLLLAVIEQCEVMGLRQLIGIAGDSENHGSIQLHVSCGFRVVGTLEQVGYKHNRWVDTVIMQRALHPTNSRILPPLA